MYSIMQHTTIVHLEDSFEDERCFYLVLELHSSITLDQYIKSINGHVHEEWMRDFVQKIASPIEFMHESGVIFRNLQLHSLLMS